MPTHFYTPPQFAKLLGVKPDKVLDWIHRGELVAINCASDPNGVRPRWRIPDDEAGKFLLRRQHGAALTPPVVRKRTRSSSIRAHF